MITVSHAFVSSIDDGTDTSVVRPSNWNAVHTTVGGTIAALDVADQIVSGGANVTCFNLGTQSSGTLTPDCGKCPLQYVTNGGPFTLNAPGADGSMILLITNSVSAGLITFSGYSVPANPGDALTMVNGSKFTISIWRINGTAGYRVAAHQ